MAAIAVCSLDTAYKFWAIRCPGLNKGIVACSEHCSVKFPVPTEAQPCSHKKPVQQHSCLLAPGFADYVLMWHPALRDKVLVSRALERTVTARVHVHYSGTDEGHAS